MLNKIVWFILSIIQIKNYNVINLQLIYLKEILKIVDKYTPVPYINPSIRLYGCT